MALIQSWNRAEKKAAIQNHCGRISRTLCSVPLSTLALEILDALPRFEGPYVFSTRAGQIPISGYSKFKKRLDEKSNVTEWRFHDVRRTIATAFGEHLGKHPYIIERIQNRRSGTIKGVMAVYNRATYEAETVCVFRRILITDSGLS